jgi:hypothetical protein
MKNRAWNITALKARMSVKSWVICSALSAALPLPSPLVAQTDYYNTDKGRPLTVEDAYPVERRAFEIQAAPLRLERSRGGLYHWSVEPEIAYGIFPRTQIEVGVPLSYLDGATRGEFGLSALELSVLHNLNVETRLPALAVAASAAFPMGAFAADEPYIAFKGIATRTLSWARFHLNGEYTIGDAPPTTSARVSEASRWMAGLAADHAFPLRSLLLAAELTLEQPLDAADRLQLGIGTGLRYQLSPRWAIDGGVGKRLTGDDAAWHVTFGSAYAFGLPWRP